MLSKVCFKNQLPVHPLRSLPDFPAIYVHFCMIAISGKIVKGEAADFFYDWLSRLNTSMERFLFR